VEIIPTTEGSSHIETLEVVENLCNLLAQREQELESLSDRIKELESTLTAQIQPDPEPVPVPLHEKSHAEMELLVAEYSNAFRNDMTRMLENSGFAKIVGVSTGQEAFDLVRRKAFDVVFIDHNLPDFTGPGLVKKIRDARPHSKIIVMVNNSDRRMIIECLEAGANDLLAKPVQAPVLHSRMEKHTRSPI